MNNGNNINSKKLTTTPKEQKYLQKQNQHIINKHNKNEIDYTNEEILFSKKLLS